MAEFLPPTPPSTPRHPPCSTVTFLFPACSSSLSEYFLLNYVVSQYIEIALLRCPRLQNCSFLCHQRRSTLQKHVSMSAQLVLCLQKTSILQMYPCLESCFLLYPQNRSTLQMYPRLQSCFLLCQYERSRLCDLWVAFYCWQQVKYKLS